MVRPNAWQRHVRTGSKMAMTCSCRIGMAPFSDLLTYVSYPPLSSIGILNRNKSVHENRIYSLNIHCGEQYPDVPPELKFISKINLPCVDAKNGKVDTC